MVFVCHALCMSGVLLCVMSHVFTPDPSVVVGCAVLLCVLYCVCVAL